MKTVFPPERATCTKQILHKNKCKMKIKMVTTYYKELNTPGGK